MEEIKDIKEIVASNLVKYRKEANLIQSQLAEKINYTDKAISKWERGESLPDIYVLKMLADIYKFVFVCDNDNGYIQSCRNFLNRNL